MNKYRWNPYLVGALIGVLSIVTFALADKPIGMSTGVAQASGACAVPVLGAETVAGNTYWSKKAVPKWDYGSLFVAGTFLGALLSALVSKSFRIELVPDDWRKQEGSSAAKRLIAAFIGGAVLLYGARLADGCTSGHGISGTMQLAVSGWTFFLVMFATGVLTTRLLYRSTSNH